MDSKTLQTLRIGDTVRIHFTHLAASRSEARGQPFDVVIAGFHNTGRAYKEEDGQYYETRQIKWKWADMPVELQPYESVRDDIRGLDSCSESWIVEIVERAPYQVHSQSRNQLYAREQASFLDHQKLEAYRVEKGEREGYYGRHPTTATGHIFSEYNETYGLDIAKSQYNGHVFNLAQMLIARRPTLSVPNRLDPDRFYAAWNKAGKPGYVGPYQVTEFSPFMRNKKHERIDPSPYKALINRKAFTNWVVRNVHLFIMTKAVDMNNMIQAAKDEEEFAAKQMEDDFRREFGESSSEDNDEEVDSDDDIYVPIDDYN